MKRKMVGKCGKYQFYFKENVFKVPQGISIFDLKLINGDK